MSLENSGGRKCVKRCLLIIFVWSAVLDTRHCRNPPEEGQNFCPPFKHQFSKSRPRCLWTSRHLPPSKVNTLDPPRLPLCQTWSALGKLMFEWWAKDLTFFGRTLKIDYHKTSFLHFRAQELPKDVFFPNSLLGISSYPSNRKNARAFDRSFTCKTLTNLKRVFI